MNKEEIEESPYCEICGHCGDIGCCGISNFIDKHIKGKTNCKNEEIIISELEDLCSYQTEVFKENKLLQSQLEQANKKLDKIKEYCNNNIIYLANSLYYHNDTDVRAIKQCEINGLDILSIIGGE